MKHLFFTKKKTSENLIFRERLKRIIFIKFFLKKKIIKSISTFDKTNIKFDKIDIKSKKIIKQNNIGVRGCLQYKFSKFANYSKISQQKTRCVITGRGLGTLRFALISRLQLRVYGRSGFLPFLKKSVF